MSKRYKLKCPQCGREFEAELPEIQGRFQFACPGGHYVRLDLPLRSEAEGTQAGPSHGKRWKVIVNGQIVKSDLLAGRSYTIGRQSPGTPSDISLPPHDEKASRRSVEVSFSDKGINLKVLKAANPIKLEDGTQLKTGDSKEFATGKSVVMTMGSQSVKIEEV